MKGKIERGELADKDGFQMPQLEKLTYFSQFFWFTLLLFSFFILLFQNNNGILGISKILKLRNQLLSQRGNKIRSKDPKNLEDISRKGFSTRWQWGFVDTLLFRIKKNRESMERLRFNLFPISLHLLIFLSLGFIVAFFLYFVWAYKTMFPEKEPHVLPNPLQVIAQFACFFFFFYWNKRANVWQRHLCLFLLFCSMSCSLYLQGIPIPFLFSLFFFYSFFPLAKSEKAIFIILGFYCADRHLAKWGFCLVFQQFCYLLLEFLLEKEQKTFVFQRLFYFHILIFGQLLLGFLCYQQIYMKEPLRLVSLLSGASIVFFCLRERPMWKFLISFGIYFFCSIIIAIAVSPINTTKILGIPSGIFIFLGTHFWLLLVCLLFFLKEGSLKGKQPLLPIFFVRLFLILPHFPEVEWLERWVEGADLLLFFKSIFSMIENGGKRATDGSRVA